MALAEPYRAKDGSGPLMVDRGHVSMVFVAPTRWGSGIGCELLDALHLTMREHGYSSASLWTRASNERARRLYEGVATSAPRMSSSCQAEIRSSAMRSRWVLRPVQSMPHEPAPAYVP
jgi:ribosomal protein S18 acetylase RimI-like enzyme